MTPRKPTQSPRSLCLAALVLGLLMPHLAVAQDAGQNGAAADGPTTFAQALAAGTTTLSFRARFEGVDQDGFDDEAEATTLRTALTYASGSYRGFRFLIEAQNVAALGDDDRYNNAGGGSLNNGVRNFPVVADPENTEINQAYLELAVGKSTFRAGRQEILLANQRFVGSVGWRQNHQAFNALAWKAKDLGTVSASYHYLDRVHRIFGDSRDMSSHLFDLAIDLGARDRLAAYGYLLDYEDPADFRLSTSTYGLRWTGHFPLDGAKVSYAFEAAQQEDAADNPFNVDAEYFLAQLDAGTKAFTVTAGWESLSGAPGDGAFSTPLATLHAFNGWADKFLRTPANGLVGLYLGLSGGTKTFRWKAVYHDFQPESQGDDYGSEIDLLATYKLKNGLVLGFKAAFYDADAFATDTDKIMFWTAYKLKH